MASSKITAFFAARPREPPEKRPNEVTERPPAEKQPKTSDDTPRVRTFPVIWLETYKWLRYDEGDNSMYCFQCKQFGHEGSWASGTRNFRLKTVQQHLMSESHKIAMAVEDPGQTLIGSQLRKQQENRKKAVELALKCAYWVSLEEIANRKYGSLITFLQELDVEAAQHLNSGKNATYKSPDIFNQLISCLSKVQEDRIKAAIKLSPFVGLGTDESTDRSLEKHLVVIVRYIGTDGTVTTQFLKLAKLAEGTAQASFHAMEEIINHFNISWKKVIGLGADGASVMSGERNGLRKLVEERNPYCTYVHCVCHRLHLAVSQACRDIPEMESLGKMVGAVYSFMSQSTKRLQQFKDIAAILDSDVIKFKKVFDIRWLSMGESIQAVVKNYEPLLVFLSQEANAGEPVALGLTQQLTSYTHLALLHLAADVLSATNHLNKLFQHRDISFGALKGTLQDCKQTLRLMLTQDGPFVEAFLGELEDGQPLMYRGQEIRTRPLGRGNHHDLTQVETFQRVRRNFLENILQNINSRFPHVDLLDAMQIFDPVSYPAEGELVGWGNQKLRTLLNHYGEQKTNQGGVLFDGPIDPDVARGEFLTFKRLVFRHRGARQGNNFQYYRPTELFRELFNSNDGQGNRVIFPEMFKLMGICVCVMVGNAEAERVFSCQNRIKSKLRTLLSIDSLDHLVRLSYTRAQQENFPFTEARELFFEANRRI